MRKHSQHIVKEKDWVTKQYDTNFIYTKDTKY